MATFRWPTGWDPILGLRYMQREIERLTGVNIFGERGIGGGSYPPVNVYNGPDEIIVECELAGVKKEDLDIAITGDTLQIKGVKHGPPDEDKLRFQRKERGEGEFNKTIVLPDKIDAAGIDARLADGILTVRLPKSEAAKPKKVQVK